jgi:hypothetical protein
MLVACSISIAAALGGRLLGRPALDTLLAQARAAAA